MKRMLSRSGSKPRIEREHIVSPTAAANALDGELLASKLFGYFDFRSRHKVAFGPTDNRAYYRSIHSSGGHVQDIVGTGKNHLNVG
jgi:hypothetical protein